MVNDKGKGKKANNSNGSKTITTAVIAKKNKDKKKFYYLFLTLFFKTVINFLIVFYVAKVVNISDFGIFTLSFVVMTIAVLLIDYGYNLHALVLNYKDEDKVSKNISSIISGKILILATLILISLPFFILTSLDQISRNVILILSISAIPNSFGNFFFSLFKAKNVYKTETIGFLIQGVLLIVLLTVNHFIGNINIITISLIILLTKFAYFAYSFIKFNREFKVNFLLSITSGVKSFKKSFNYGTHLILGTLILYIDTLFLSYFTDMESVGYYQSGMRLIMAASLFGAIITDGFVPEISRQLNNKRYITNRMVNLFSFLFVFYFLLLITLGIYFKSIIRILYSSEFEFISKYLIYILSIIMLRAMGIVPGVILTSLGLQRIRAKAVAYSCAVSIVLNLVLIPLFGLEGAFISFLATNILLNGIYIFFAAKEIGFIRIVIPNIILVLIVYLIIQLIFSNDNTLFLFISIIINLLIQFFAQKSIKKRNSYVTN